MNKSVCITGHRPEKISGAKNATEYIHSQLKIQIEKSIQDGYNTFYIGMARGIDIIAGEILLKEKIIFKNIKIIAVIPFRHQSDGWSKEWQYRYNSLIKQVDEIITISKEYKRLCFKKRNEYMVEHSDKVIAVFSGELGGTHNTILYAKKLGKDVTIISEADIFI